MKKIFIIIMLAGLVACSDSRINEIQQLKAELDSLSKRNDEISIGMDSLQQTFVLPFEAYQQIVMTEKETHPDSIIQAYSALIDKYPDSFWSHEAQKRITNIESRRKCWKNDRWDFSAEQKKEEQTMIVPEVVSCPGC